MASAQISVDLSLIPPIADRLAVLTRRSAAIRRHLDALVRDGGAVEARRCGGTVRVVPSVQLLRLLEQHEPA